MSTLDSCIVYDITVAVGCSKARAFRGDGQWPIEGAGLTGLTISAQVRKTESAPDVLVDLTNTTNLVLDDQTIRLTFPASTTDALGAGVYHYGIRAHDAATGAVYALVRGTLRIVPFADRNA